MMFKEPNWSSFSFIYVDLVIEKHYSLNVRCRTQIQVEVKWSFPKRGPNQWMKSVCWGIGFCKQSWSSFNKISSCNISILFCQYSYLPKRECDKKKKMACVPKEDRFWGLRLSQKFRPPGSREQKKTFLIYPSIDHIA